MRSSPLDHYHQEGLNGCSSLAAAPAFYDHAIHREWNQHQMLNYDYDFISDASGVPPTQTIQDLGFHWAVNGEGGSMNQLPAHQNSCPKLNEFNMDGSSNEDCQLQEKLFVRSIASDCQTDLLQPLPGNLSETSRFDSSRGSGRGIINMAFSTSARFGRSFCPPSFTSMASSGVDHLPESIQGPFHHHHKMPPLVSGGTEAKGSNSSWEHESPLSTMPRKPRVEQRSSFSPFKVRKEKLGDRIAALQQLVAPFGKTDTASVLMEAIGYIKFLLDQVEKLSVPYLRPSGNKRSRTSMQEASNEESDEPAKRGLRSRGLCLVPLSYTSYMTSEHAAWSPR
nr:PREDICTED: transcription factor bHLH110-like isoform X2 [Musa acuminata subsp. malaccensis]